MFVPVSIQALAPPLAWCIDMGGTVAHFPAWYASLQGNPHASDIMDALYELVRCRDTVVIYAADGSPICNDVDFALAAYDPERQLAILAVHIDTEQGGDFDSLFPEDVPQPTEGFAAFVIIPCSNTGLTTPALAVLPQGEHAFYGKGTWVGREYLNQLFALVP